MTEDEPPRNDETPPGEEGDGKVKKTSLDDFIRRVSQSFAFQAEELGAIQCRTLTSSMATALLKRLPDPANTTDFDVVRVFMGCASGIPVDADKTVSKPLTEEQAATLTDNDVRRFATEYLANIVKPEAVVDPIAQMAAHVRDEHEKTTKSFKDMTKTIADTLASVSGNAGMLQNWKLLREQVEGPFAKVQEELKRVLGPSMTATDSIRQALKSIQDDHQSMLNGLGGLTMPSMGSMAQISPMPERMIRIPEFTMPPDEKTLPGRTAIAAEGLKQVGERMEEAMNAIVGQVGEVSTLIGDVSRTIQQESRTVQENGEKQTKKAMTAAKWSLGISAVALVVSALFGGFGYWADRQDAHSQNGDTQAVIAQMKDQNSVLSTLVEQQRKTLEVQQQALAAQKAEAEASQALLDRLTAPPKPAEKK